MAEQKTSKPRKQQPVDNTYAHLQPQAVEIERAVLGALMIDKDAYAIVCETLSPESFYEPRNQRVYQAVMELSMRERPVDIWTVTEQTVVDIPEGKTLTYNGKTQTGVAAGNNYTLTGAAGIVKVYRLGLL